MHHGISKGVKTTKVLHEPFLVGGKFRGQLWTEEAPVMVDDLGEMNESSVGKRIVNWLRIFLPGLNTCSSDCLRDTPAPPACLFGTELRIENTSAEVVKRQFDI